jgi:hypothetical protein
MDLLNTKDENGEHSDGCIGEGKVDENGEHEGGETTHEQSAASEGNESSGTSVAIGEGGNRHDVEWTSISPWKISTIPIVWSHVTHEIRGEMWP